MRLNTLLRPVIIVSCLLLCYPVGIGSNRRGCVESVHFANSVPDISGLAWLHGDSFIAVHDAKNPEENDRQRVSILSLPKTLDGIIWKALAIDWPLPLGASGDLESIARIPDTNSFLLVESGEGRVSGSRFRRVFLVEVKDNHSELISFTELPELVKNIEGSAVVRLGKSLVFVCAERGDSRMSTEMYWTELQMSPLRLGSFHTAYFKPVGFTGPNKRPVSAIEVDSMGRLYIASAYDPNDDNGPFSSVIWRAGGFVLDRNNRIGLALAGKPQKLATMDGLKIESLAIREKRAGVIELFAGTDDENYGGAVRAIPMAP